MSDEPYHEPTSHDRSEHDPTHASPTVRRPFGLDRHFPFLTTWDIAVNAFVLLQLSVLLPFFFTWWNAPRFILLLIAAPFGVVAWTRLLVRRDPGAYLLAALCAWATLSTLASGSVLVSFRGTIGDETTLAVVLGASLCWSLARSLSADGRRLLVPTIVAGMAIQLLVALLQLAVQANQGIFELYSQRASGFTPNPVHFAAISAGAFGLVVGHAIQRWRPSIHLLGIATFSLCVGLSGSRIGLLSILVVSVVAAWRLRSDLARIAQMGAAVLVGQAVGMGLLALAGSGRSSASRLGISATTGGRSGMWRAAVDAWLERPILGHGFNRFDAAIQDDVPSSFFRSFPDAQIYSDAHNLVIHLAVTIGVVGLALAAAFVWWNVRHGSGPLLWFAAGTALVWLLQPLNVLPLVLVLVALAASIDRSLDTDSTHRVEPSRWMPAAVEARPLRPAIATGAMVLGLALAAPLAVVEFELDAATSAADGERVANIGGYYADDPVIANLAAQLLLPDAADDPRLEARLIELTEDSIEYDDTDPAWWTERAAYAGFFQHYDDVRPALDEALRLQPTYVRAWTVLLAFSRDRDDAVGEREALDAMCELGQEFCDRTSTSD
ncbi:MAG: O-antigen ligase family protein [Actinomycetota bacterium]